MSVWKVLVTGQLAWVTLACALSAIVVPINESGSDRWLWAGGLLACAAAAGTALVLFMRYAGRSLDVPPGWWAGGDGEGSRPHPAPGAGMAFGSDGARPPRRHPPRRVPVVYRLTTLPCPNCGNSLHVETVDAEATDKPLTCQCPRCETWFPVPGGEAGEVQPAPTAWARRARPVE